MHESQSAAARQLSINKPTFEQFQKLTNSSIISVPQDEVYCVSMTLPEASGQTSQFANKYIFFKQNSKNQLLFTMKGFVFFYAG